MFRRSYIARALTVISIFFVLLPSIAPAYAQSFVVSTTVEISVCGNGIVEGNEVCDNGTNTGAYATSTANRNCLPDCSGYGPYCGDNILQQRFGEQCDAGALNGTNGSLCSATCQILPQQPSGGGGSGGGYSSGSSQSPHPTEVIIKGKAYPFSNVNILKDGTTIGVVQADSSANFYFDTTNITSGVTTFGLWAEDANGLKSIALTTTLTVTANAITTISGEFLPPTIELSTRQVAPGGTLHVDGQSAPDVTVQTEIHSTNPLTISTTTDAKGNWGVDVDTSQLAPENFHTADAFFETTDANGNPVKSAYSQAISFYVGNNNVGKKFIADLNGDGKVNLADFSILLYYWGTSSSLADLNGDGTVNLADFSIMLFYWTG